MFEMGWGRLMRGQTTKGANYEGIVLLSICFVPILKFRFYFLIPKNFVSIFSIFSVQVPDPYLKGHGSLAHAYKWYSKILPPLVVEMVDRAGFGGFVR